MRPNVIIEYFFTDSALTNVKLSSKPDVIWHLTNIGMDTVKTAIWLHKVMSSLLQATIELCQTHGSDVNALKVLFSSLTLISKLFYSLNFQVSSVRSKFKCFAVSFIAGVIMFFLFFLESCQSPSSITFSVLFNKRWVYTAMALALIWESLLKNLFCFPHCFTSE